MKGFTPLEIQQGKTNLRSPKGDLALTGFTPPFVQGNATLRRAGFTLIEILVGTLILGILIAAIYQVLDIAEKAYSVDMGLLDLQQQARQGLDLMVRELREAQGLQITVIDANSHQIIFDSFDEPGTKYYRDTNDVNNDGLTTQIIREYPTGTRKVLANAISKLNFCCVGGSSCTDCFSSRILQVAVQADKTVKQRPLSFSLTEEVNLRNENE